MGELGNPTELVEQEYIDPEYLSIDERIFDDESELNPEYYPEVYEEVTEHSEIIAKYDSIEDIVKDIFPDIESLEEVDLATEVAFLTREGREWMSKDEEGNVVSQTQQLEGTEYAGLHLDILGELYEQGYSVSEYFEGDVENTFIYFADSRGRISFAHYRKVEEESFGEDESRDVELDESEDGIDEDEDIYLDLTPLLTEGDGNEIVRVSTRESFFESFEGASEDKEVTEDILQSGELRSAPLVIRQSEVVAESLNSFDTPEAIVEQPIFIDTSEPPAETVAVATEISPSIDELLIEASPIAQVTERSEKPSGIELFFEDQVTEDVVETADVIETVEEAPESIIDESEIITESVAGVKGIEPPETVTSEIAEITIEVAAGFEAQSETTPVASTKVSESSIVNLESIVIAELQAEIQVEQAQLATEPVMTEGGITLEVVDRVESDLEEVSPITETETLQEAALTVGETERTEPAEVVETQFETENKPIMETLSAENESAHTEETPAFVELAKPETEEITESVVTQEIAKPIEILLAQTEALSESVADEITENGSIELTIAPEKTPEIQTGQPIQDREQTVLQIETVKTEAENILDKIITLERVTVETVINLEETQVEKMAQPTQLTETQSPITTEVQQPLVKLEKVQAKESAIKVVNESKSAPSVIEKGGLKNNEKTELTQTSPEAPNISSIFERSSNRRTTFSNYQTGSSTNDALTLEQDGIILRQTA